MKISFPSAFFLALGTLIIGFGVFLLIQRYNPQRLSLSDAPVLGASASHLFPKEITIADVNVDLSIFPAQIKNNTWEATTKGASYLVSSPVPGEIGNSVIYAHNWTSLFGPITRVKPGEKIQITYDNNTKKTFIVTYTTVVSPDQTGILSSTNDRRITLYTCTGFLDSKRFVVTAIES